MLYTVRRASHADLLAFFGEGAAELSMTMKAMVGVISGRVLAIGGIIYPGSDHPPYVFLNIAPDAPRRPVSVSRATREALASICTGSPLLCVCDSGNPKAPRFLRHLGFELAGESVHGPVYRYDPRGERV